MDSVQLTAFSPQEEEFALACMTRYSPYWFGCFPRLFAEHEKYIYPDRMEPRERAAWSRQFVHFLRKVTFWSRKSPLLKSPYNTARVAAPARDVSTGEVRPHRAASPCDLSLEHAPAEHGWAVFQVQDADGTNSFATHFLENYRGQEEAYYRDTAKLPEDDVAELRFEDLEIDPVGEVRRLYAELNLEFTPQFEKRLNNYLASIAGYRKNKFKVLPIQQQQEIDAVMGDFSARWGYADGMQSQSAPKAA